MESLPPAPALSLSESWKLKERAAAVGLFPSLNRWAMEQPGVGRFKFGAEKSKAVAGREMPRSVISKHGRVLPDCRVYKVQFSES